MPLGDLSAGACLALGQQWMPGLMHHKPLSTSNIQMFAHFSFLLGWVLNYKCFTALVQDFNKRTLLPPTIIFCTFLKNLMGISV